MVKTRAHSHTHTHTHTRFSPLLSTFDSDIWSCRRRIFLEVQEYTSQALWTRSHSHRTSVWKSWHPLAEDHKRHHLTTDTVLCDLKTAIIKPLMKELLLDKNPLKNYHPIFLPVQNYWKSWSPQTSVTLSRKKPMHPLPVSLSRRPQHWDHVVNNILSALDKDHFWC